MSSLFDEGLVSLAEASKLKNLPQRRAGKRPHICTLIRWVTIGLSGIRLEAVRVGGTWCTSVPAISRFFERLAAVQSGEPAATAPSYRSPSRRQRDVERAERELAKVGI